MTYMPTLTDYPGGSKCLNCKTIPILLLENADESSWRLIKEECDEWAGSDWRHSFGQNFTCFLGIFLHKSRDCFAVYKMWSAGLCVLHLLDNIGSAQCLPVILNIDQEWLHFFFCFMFWFFARFIKQIRLPKLQTFSWHVWRVLK